MKTCSKCKKEKELNDFYNHKNSKDGKSNQCKICMTEHRNKPNVRKYNKEYMQKLRETNPEKAKETKRKSYRRNIKSRLLYQCKSRAKTRNIEFDLTIDDIVIPKKCPLLNKEFEHGKKGDYQYTYSIDRVDNSKGYVKGNIQIISMKANSMKNNATEDELITFAKNILKYYKEDIV